MADVLIRRKAWRRVVRSSLEKVPVGGSGGSYGRAVYCRARTVRYESREFSVRLPNTSLDELSEDSIDGIVRQVESKLAGPGSPSLPGSKKQKLLPYSRNRYYSLY